MSNRKNISSIRVGFSLVEILLVLAIVAIVAALIIPAIAAVRRSAARAKDANNIRQMLFAVHNYYSQNNSLPKSGDLNGFKTACVPASRTFDNATMTTSFSCDPKTGGMFLGVKYSGNVAYPAGTPVAVLEATGKTNWIDGGPHFLILPYMGESAVYESTYGPITIGAKSKTYQSGNWTTRSSLVNCAANQGWQAIKGQGQMVKTLISDNDPSILLPHVLSPVSYLFTQHLATANMETSATAHIPLLAESYSTCDLVIDPTKTPWSDRTTFGTNYSWAAAGVMSNTDNEWAQSTTSRTITIGFPKRAYGWHTEYSGYLTDIGTGECPYDESEYGYNGASCGQDRTTPGRIGEWYIYKQSSYGHTFYFEENPAMGNCKIDDPRSHTTGYINIGMLDGSIRLLSNTADARIWNALAQGVSPTSYED